jgi:hypothetical protein
MDRMLEEGVEEHSFHLLEQWVGDPGVLSTDGHAVAQIR